MTVKELRENLSKFDDKTHIAVYWGEGDEHQVFEIDDVIVAKGSTRRIDGKVRLKFDSEGPETWLFINIDPA